MDYTKKIISYSNYWYNDGLKKAQMKDLSGAIVSLRESLKFNKNNIQARNLLGLVYYGRGEVPEALVEWILSKNLQPENNPADHYLQKIQETPRKLETVNQAIRKYNQSISLCENRGEDMAILQLKRAIAEHPTFLKAYQLLALIYIHTGQEKEHKPLRRKRDSVEYNLGNETIIQPVHSAVQEAASRSAWLYIVLGILFGAAIVWFLITPASRESQAEKHNREILEYSEKINAQEAQISALTRTLNQYRAADTTDESQTAAGTAESYDFLLNAINQWESGEYSDVTIANSLYNINRNALGSEGQVIYDSILEDIMVEACETAYNEGLYAITIGDYAAAIDYLSKVVWMDESYEDGQALLNLGVAYMSLEDNASATTYFSKVKELYPDSEIAAQANTHLEEMAKKEAENDKEEGTTTE